MLGVLNRPHRRIRFRMYGGVGGAESRDSPLSRLRCALAKVSADHVSQIEFDPFERSPSRPFGVPRPIFRCGERRPRRFLGLLFPWVKKGSGAHTMIASRGIALVFSRPQANGRLVSAVIDICKW